MNKINYLLFTILSLFVLQGCGDDSASNPSFDDKDVPRIYIDWRKDMTFSTGDTIRLHPNVSPADGATFKWTLNGREIGDEKGIEYIIPDDEYGEFVLKYEVERNGVINSRVSNVAIAKIFVPKTGYNKKSVAFVTRGGNVGDIKWDNITHIILSSSVIQASGLPDLSFGGDALKVSIPSLITAAHNNGVYVLVEFSGTIDYTTGQTPYGNFDFYNAATSPKVRTEMIKAMVDYTLATGFDGINIRMDKASDGSFSDYPALRAFYEEVAESVPEETDRADFLLTMSVVSGWTKAVFDGMVTTPGYDWVHIHSYCAEDLTPTAHSPFWLFADDAQYWVDKGVDKGKIVPVAPTIGLRYFGDTSEYTWGNLWSFTEYKGYKAICTEYPDAPGKNKIDVDNGLFYDGLNEVKAKAEHVVAQGYGGMGLWSIDNDNTENGKSLMQQINTSLGN